MKKFFFAAVAVLLPWLASAQFKVARPDDVNSAASDVNYDQPKEYEIADITVTGLQFIQPEGIISVSGLKVGDRIQVPGEDISNAIRKIWNLSIVGDVDINYTKIEGEKIYLNIAMKERARLSKFTFKGIRKGETETLSDKIKLIKGKIVTDALVKNTQLAVKKHFMDKGFFNAKVNIRQVKDSSALGNSVALVIEVDKNRKVKINSIQIEGNQVFADKKLKRKLKGTKEKKITHVFTPSKFIRSKYEEDKQKLIKFYNSEGYRDAVIVSDTVKTHDDRTIDVVINLEEGQKYYFRNITWSGNYKYTDEQLGRVLGLNKGDVYNVEELEKRLTFNPTGSDITSLYMDDGYLFFQVRPVEVGVTGDSVDIEMRLTEGEQATISRVTVSGNTQTSDHVALREMYTIPGRKFSRTDVINTQRELSALGFFDPEKTNPEINPNPADGTVDINWAVEEKPSDQIELSGGWGGFYGFVGTLGLTFNNFSTRKLFDWSAWRPIPKGDGQKLSLRVQASGPSFQSYSASFTEPWFGGKRRNAFSLSLSHSVQSDFFNNRRFGTNRNFQITAVTVGLARRLQVPDNWFTLSTSASYLIYRINEYEGLIPGIVTGTSHNFTLNATLSRNTIDNPTFPRRGSSLSLSGSATPPWSKFNFVKENVEQYSPTKLLEYHKWMFDANWFVNLTGKLVLSTRAHMGFIGNYNGSGNYTPFERFYLGGNGLNGVGGFFLGRDIIGMRGYDTNALNPRGLDPAANRQDDIGGVAYNKFVTEIRYPVSLNPAATIFVLGFVEGGNVWTNYSEFNPFRIRRTAGVGARIFMPAFGLIGIDWGYGFDPIPGRENQGRQMFQFSIGQQLR
ncbi:MAG: Outer membrane protein assembly factor YaeT [uncultured Cytophagales bacterium]|uniref:Outer membrane protein assembly factor BamA n=1 Tax=uncultured Cytophagales bacterium TaxID=158755 RepID=A0A6J4L7K1_9SPHI|nr:MAG: Outer membrane protein assembly factor YaeT [uncultured Cytophagales bacterium]